MTGEDGGTHRLGAGDLALLLAEHRSLRLVVLNSCDTARASASDRFSSTASVLLRRGIPAVVAMQYEISDEAAITFARGFYTATGSIPTTVHHPPHWARLKSLVSCSTIRSV